MQSRLTRGSPLRRAASPESSRVLRELFSCPGILRNVPFTILGALIVVLFYRSAKEKQDAPSAGCG